VCPDCLKELLTDWGEFEGGEYHGKIQ